jgi:hypothetical protein
MSPATVTFHETLIRLMKGVISAWEKWLDSQKRDSKF